MSKRTYTEPEFSQLIKEKLKSVESLGIKSVSGPGRSGAIAAVYASYILKIPFIYYGQTVPVDLRPHLVIDTAKMSGRTLKRAALRMRAQYMLAVIEEKSHEHFWYES